MNMQTMPAYVLVHAARYLQKCAPTLWKLTGSPRVNVLDRLTTSSSNLGKTDVR